MDRRFDKRRGEEGFTLIELLVVIIILGILSAVVVFAVRGSGDKGQKVAQQTDIKTVRTAQEAFCAKVGRYGDMDELTGAKPVNGATYRFLSEKSTMTAVAPVAGGPCTASGDTAKSGFITGCAQPNCGSGDKIDSLTLAATAGTQFGYPTPFHYARGPGHLNANYMFDPMLWRDATGQPIPWLATEVPALGNGGITNGGLTYTFSLRSGVTWHDGQPFSADDVKFTFDYQKTGAPGAATPCFCKAAFANITSVDAVNATTVRFNLAQPSNIFLGYIGQQMIIIPKHIWQGIPNPTDSSVTSNPLAYVGTGPYKPTNPSAGSYNPATGVQQYDANTSYFLGTPFVRQLRFVTASDPIAALTTRQVDAGGVGSEEGVTASALNALSGLPRVDNPGGWNRAFHFNIAKGFPYNDVKFRQATAYAIDRQALLSSIVGGRGVVGSMGNLTPSNPWFAPGLPTYDQGSRAQNITAGKALLDELGIVDTNNDGKRECPAANPCKVVSGDVTGAPTITNSSTPANFVPNIHTSPSFNGGTVTAIKQYLLDIGLDSAIVTDTSGPNSDTRMRNGNYGLGVVGWGNLQSDPDSLRTRLDHTYTSVTSNASFTNIFGWNNTANATTFMALAQQQLTELDPAVRKQKVQQMQQAVAADVPVISLYVPQATQFYHPDRLTAWYYTPGGTPAGPPGFNNKHVFITGKQFGLPAGL